MPEYERLQLAIIIQGAFFDLPDSQPIPFSHNPIADYWKNVEEIQGQLTDPVKVEEIYQMLVSVADGTKPEDRYYTSRQEALDAMLSYREGTYSLFGEKREPRQIAPATLETEPEAEKATEEEPSPFIQHFYVIPDLKVAGQLEVQTYSSFEEAFAAYSALPKGKLKALGVQNTMPRPGSLDFIQCREGMDTLVEDYLTAEGWDNPEISQLVDAIRHQIDQPASEQEQPAAATSDRVDEMLRQAMDNVIDGIAGKLKTASAELTETQVQMENAREEMKAPFAKETELKEKEARLKELNILLNMDQKDRSLIDDTPKEDIPDKPRPRGIER